MGSDRHMKMKRKFHISAIITIFLCGLALLVFVVIKPVSNNHQSISGSEMNLISSSPKSEAQNGLNNDAISASSKAGCTHNPMYGARIQKSGVSIQNAF